MVFSSILFLVYFLPIFIAIYYLIPARFKNLTVLAFSIFFYAWGAPLFVFILLGSTFLDYFIVNAMHRSSKEERKKRWLALSLILNVGLLLYFKYANFFIENVNGLLSSLGAENLDWTSVALPIGISFYTFQTLSYSIDVYRGKSTPLDKVWDYMLYIIMFPQLIAGPIVRYNSIAHQIKHRPHHYQESVYGIIRFCIGLAKKVLIANVLAEYADDIFSRDYDTLSSSEAWLGILAYTFQIYFDFSGYSDMAIGIGRMIGFKFPENFESPYTSRSISEFWRRWHITLGEWMRSYLYIPLGGNRSSSPHRVYFNLIIVFLISGLWHGAAWSFIVWGLYHGFFLVIERVGLRTLLKKIPKFLSVSYAFMMVMLGWVLFRIEDFGSALEFYQRLFSFEFSMSTVPSLEFVIILIIAVFFSFLRLWPAGERLKMKVFDSLPGLRFSYLLIAVSFILYILSLGAIAGSSYNPFIYFRF